MTALRYLAYILISGSTLLIAFTFISNTTSFICLVLLSLSTFAISLYLELSKTPFPTTFLELVLCILLIIPAAKIEESTLVNASNKTQSHQAQKITTDLNNTNTISSAVEVDEVMTKTSFHEEPSTQNNENTVNIENIENKTKIPNWMPYSLVAMILLLRVFTGVGR